MDSGREKSGLAGVVDALVEGLAIDWTEVRARFTEHGGRVRSLELLDQVRQAFRAAGETPEARPPPFQWGSLRVLEMLGEGSFGEVFRAHDLVLDREVALKLRHRDDDASRSSSYVAEARRLARVRHPNVVVVHGAEVHDGRAGLWTELIDGDTLAAVLERRGPMGAREALAVGLDLCRALAAVHAAGLLHGDVKPANVMRERGGRTVLMDFGAGHELLRPTHDASAFGTPAVTAPEVLNGETPAVAADLYSLGALLFRALTGTHRIEATTLSELLRKHESKDCRDLRDLRPDLAYETVRAVERALERAPEDRYAGAGAMERGLAGALDQELSRVSDATARAGAHTVSELGVATPTRHRRMMPGEPDFQPFVGGRAETGNAEAGGSRRRVGATWLWIAAGIAAATWVGTTLWNGRVAPTDASTFHGTDWQLRDMQVFSASPGNQDQATFSPDGRMVAFVDDTAGVPQIGIRAVAGGESLRVTEGEAAASRPRWSSHDEIVFSRNGGIWAVPALGGEPRQMVAAGTHPDVSRDGTLVVYEHDRWLWTVAADGGAPRRLQAVPRRFFAEAWATPALSPDASRVAYFMQEAGPTGDIWVAPIDGGEPRRLTFDRVEAGGPVWTPDGSSIIFWSRRHGTLNLWRLRLDDGSLQPITTGIGEDTAPAISADGRRLVFTNTQNRWVLVGLDPETGEERELLDRRLPVWLPEVSTDGGRVAFFQAVGPSYHLFTLGLDGSAPRQVTTGEGIWNIHPRWSHDGNFLYYYQERPREAFRRVPASGGESELIAEEWDWLTQPQAVPSPDDSRIAYVEHNEHTGSTLIWDPGTDQRVSLPAPHIDSPQWSPDGRVLVGFTHGGEIRRCEVDRGTCVRLTDGFRPRFSADGGTVYLHRRSGAAQWELWSIGLDGRDERRLATTGPHGPLDPTFAVTPNGEVVYTRYRPGRSELWIASLKP